MLHYYSKRSLGEAIRAGVKPHSDDVWVHAESVVTDDLSYSTEKYDLSPNIIRDVRDVSELPRVEYADDALYIFLRTPRRTKHGEVHTSPLLSIIQKNRFFTLAYSDSFRPDEIINGNAVDIQTDPIALALATFAAVVSSYENILHRTSRAVRDVGNRLRTHEVTNRDIIRFAVIEDNLNECGTSLDGMVVLARHLQENKRNLFSDADIEMIDDIILHTQQLLVSAASQRQSVTSIRDAYTTIANNGLNQRMKTLTVLTVLIALPNVFYGMYGMNVALPFADQPWAYSAVVVFTITIIFIVYALARRFKIF